MKMLVVSSCLLALVLVSAVPFHPPPISTNTRLLLDAMMNTLKHLKDLLKTQNVGRRLTLKVIDEHSCKPEDFCKVEKVLSGIDHEKFRGNGTIVRQLKEFNRQVHLKTNCHMEETTKIALSEVLRHLRTCLQKTYQNNHRKD